MVDQVFQQRSVQHGAGFEFLARNGRSDDGEDSRTDHCSDSKRGEAEPAEGFLEAFFGSIGVGDELVDALGAEKLWVQSPPSPCDRRKLYLERPFGATCPSGRAVTIMRSASLRNAREVFWVRNPGSSP